MIFEKKTEKKKNTMFIQLGPILRQCIVVVIANLSVLAFGMGAAWPSPVLVQLNNETDAVLVRPITEEEGSWIVSVPALTMIPANFIAAHAADRIGRKYCMIFVNIPKIVGILLYLFGKEVWMIMLGRTLEGLAEAFALNTIPMYVSEIASKSIRGNLGTIFQICASLGVVTMMSVGPFASYFTINLMYLFVTIIALLPTIFLPESPYFLYSKGRKEDAVKVLTFLRGSETTAMEEMKEYALENKDTEIDKRHLFKDKIFLRGVVLVIILGIGNQLVGYNPNLFYLQTILNTTHTSVKPEIVSVIVGLIQLIASFCTAVTTDRFGRKPILISTLIGMTFGMAGLGAFFKLVELDYQIAGFLNYLPLICFILISFTFSAGMGSIYWVIITELFDGPGRSTGVCISVVTTTATMFFTLKYFYIINSYLGAPITYWSFSTICVLLGLFIAVFVPETKDRTFSEIQVALGAKRTSR